MKPYKWLQIVLIGVAFMAWCRGMVLGGDETCTGVMILALLFAVSIYIRKAEEE